MRKKIMKCLHFMILLRSILCNIYEEKTVKTNQKWSILVDESTPSKLACVQKALYFKGEASFDGNRCKVVKRDDSPNGVELLTKTYLYRVGDMKKLNDLKISNTEKWRKAKTIIKEKTKMKKNTLVTKIAPFKDEFRLSIQIYLNAYNNQTEALNVIKFSDESNHAIKVNHIEKKIIVSSTVSSKTSRIRSSIIIPLHQWFFVKIIQERKRMNYSLTVSFNNIVTGTIDLGTKAPSWKDVDVFVSGSHNLIADGFVRNILLYEKN